MLASSHKHLKLYTGTWQPHLANLAQVQADVRSTNQTLVEAAVPTLSSQAILLSATCESLQLGMLD